MKNLNVGKRLAIGFGALIVFIVFVSVMAITRLQGQQNSADEVINDVYPKAASAQTLAYLAVDVSRIVRNLILLSDEAAMAKNKVVLDTDRRRIDELVTALEKKAKSDEERGLIKTITETRAAYTSYINEVIALGLANKNDEGTKLLFGERYATQGAYISALLALVTYEEKSMQDGSAAARAVADQTRLVMIFMGVLAAVIGAACAWFISRSITMPLQGAVKAARTIAAGDLTGRIEVTSKDELGELQQAMQQMNANLLATISQVRSGSDTIATASSQIAAGNLDLSSRTEEQASSLEETASSMEELTSTVKQNADNARQANGLAMTASEVAKKGGTVVAEVVGTMTAINDSSRKIVDIIAVIDGIAFQTNILALNAAVEAARAGEQGRGFAVVAAEVRNLAQRSAAAAKEIKTLIGDSVEKVEIGARLVDQAGVTMSEIVESVKRVTDIMGEITAASQEQTAGIEQINTAITQMDEVTQQNAALVEEAAAAAESLQDQAAHLSQVVSVFNTGGTQSALPAPATTSRMKEKLALAKRVTSAVPKRALATRSAVLPIAGRPVVAAAGGEWESF